MSDLKQTIEENFSRYAGNVILDRAICDVRDMMKPAARMLTYSQLHISKNTNDKPFIKSARVVGDCLGHYYTHGDMACYANYMRMAKPFAMRYPLEECQGNSGTINAPGDEAASRYTEMRLSKLGTALFNDIDKETIELWSDNFDETDKYPNVLPSKGFYNIVNGTTGIGVAISSSIPQFNLREINNALIRLLWNEDAPDSQVIVMPDFATGATLLNSNEVKESLKEGRGAACILQAVVDYDAQNRCFNVKELPYGVYTNTLTSQIERLLEEQPECGIEGINDGSGKSPDYNIYISKSANPDKVLQLLYKETSLRSSFTINMTVLKDGRTPKVMGLREMLLEHIKHEMIIYRRGYEFDKRKIEKRIHILDGLLICLANIDEVVQTIKSSNSTQDATRALKEKFLLDDAQTKAVLDMKLSRLAHLEVEKIKKEKDDLTSELNEIIMILNDESLLKKEIEKGFRDIAVKYGDERRTKILNNATTNGEEIEVSTNKLAIILNKDQKIRAINLDEFKSTGKGTKGVLIDKNIVDIICADSRSTIIAADKEGYLYPISTTIIPIADEGVSISSLCECGEIVKLARFDEKKYVLITTNNGMMKKSLMSEYNFTRKVAGLKLKENDFIKTINFVDSEDYVILINDNGKINNFSVDEIKTSGRMTFGSKGSTYGVKSLTIANKNSEILTYSIDGKGKKTKFDDIPANNRSSSGILAADDTIGIATINGDIIVLCGDTGRIIALKSSDISLHSIRGAGSKLLNGKIIAAESV